MRKKQGLQESWTQVSQPHYEQAGSCPKYGDHSKLQTQLQTLYLETSFVGQLLSYSFGLDHKSRVLIYWEFGESKKKNESDSDPTQSGKKRK
jgi:hypothetical protein